MTEHVIGIDPGVTGALALLTDKGDLVEISDMPSLADGTKGRSTVNSPLLAELLARWHARQVFCEWTGSDRVQKALTLSDAASTIPERPYWTRFSADADAVRKAPYWTSNPTPRSPSNSKDNTTMADDQDYPVGGGFVAAAFPTPLLLKVHIWTIYRD